MRNFLLSLIGVGLMSISLIQLGYADDFMLKSSAITSGKSISNEQVFNGFGCTGSNISPDLFWSHAPPNTKAYAVTVFDPDAPTGSGWWHWVVFNIPSAEKGLPLNAGDPKAGLMPKGAIQSKTDFGTTAYGGPCPPIGDKLHHYHFRVYALKNTVPLTADTPAAQVAYYINLNKLAEAELVATFGR